LAPTPSTPSVVGNVTSSVTVGGSGVVCGSDNVTESTDGDGVVARQRRKRRMDDIFGRCKGGR
jgi:hypothetical protein